MNSEQKLSVQELSKACAEAPLFGVNGKALILQAVGKAYLQEEGNTTCQEELDKKQEASIVTDNKTSLYQYKGEDLYSYVKDKEKPTIDFLIKTQVPRNIRQSVLNKYSGKFLAILAQELRISPNRIQKIVESRKDFKRLVFQAATQQEKQLYEEVESKQVYVNLASRANLEATHFDQKELQRLKQVYRVAKLQSDTSKIQSQEIVGPHHMQNNIIIETQNATDCSLKANNNDSTQNNDISVYNINKQNSSEILKKNDNLVDDFVQQNRSIDKQQEWRYVNQKQYQKERSKLIQIEEDEIDWDILQQPSPISDIQYDQQNNNTDNQIIQTVSKAPQKDLKYFQKKQNQLRKQQNNNEGNLSNHENVYQYDQYHADKQNQVLPFKQSSLSKDKKRHQTLESNSQQKKIRKDDKFNDLVKWQNDNFQNLDAKDLYQINNQSEFQASKMSINSVQNDVNQEIDQDVQKNTSKIDNGINNQPISVTSSLLQQDRRLSKQLLSQHKKQLSSQYESLNFLGTNIEEPSSQQYIPQQTIQQNNSVLQESQNAKSSKLDKKHNLNQKQITHDSTKTNSEMLQGISYQIKKFTQSLLNPVLDSGQINLSTYKIIINKVAEKALSKANPDFSDQYIQQNRNKIIDLVYKYIKYYGAQQKQQ